MGVCPLPFLGTWGQNAREGIDLATGPLEPIPWVFEALRTRPRGSGLIQHAPEMIIVPSLPRTLASGSSEHLKTGISS